MALPHWAQPTAASQAPIKLNAKEDVSFYRMAAHLSGKQLYPASNIGTYGKDGHGNARKGAIAFTAREDSDLNPHQEMARSDPIGNTGSTHVLIRTLVNGLNGDKPEDLESAIQPLGIVSWGNDNSMLSTASVDVGGAHSYYNNTSTRIPACSYLRVAVPTVDSLKIRAQKPRRDSDKHLPNGSHLGQVEATFVVYEPDKLDYFDLDALHKVAEKLTDGSKFATFSGREKILAEAILAVARVRGVARVGKDTTLEILGDIDNFINGPGDVPDIVKTAAQAIIDAIDAKKERRDDFVYLYRATIEPLHAMLRSQSKLRMEVERMVIARAPNEIHPNSKGVVILGGYSS